MWSSLVSRTLGAMIKTLGTNFPEGRHSAASRREILRFPSVYRESMLWQVMASHWDELHLHTPISNSSAHNDKGAVTCNAASVNNQALELGRCNCRKLGAVTAFQDQVLAIKKGSSSWVKERWSHGCHIWKLQMLQRVAPWPNVLGQTNHPDTHWKDASSWGLRKHCPERLLRLGGCVREPWSDQEVTFIPISWIDTTRNSLIYDEFFMTSLENVTNGAPSMTIAIFYVIDM
jgi:hypothetical protein